MRSEDFIFDRVDGGKHCDYWFKVVGETKDELTDHYMEQSMIEVSEVVFSIKDGQYGVKRLFPFNYDVVDNPQHKELYEILKKVAFDIHREQIGKELAQSMSRRWAVVGVAYEKAVELMDQIENESGKEVLKRVRGKYELITEFADGTLLRWVRAAESSRGHRFGKMWCDRNIDANILRTVIMPCYWGKLEDIIWV